MTMHVGLLVVAVLAGAVAGVVACGRSEALAGGPADSPSARGTPQAAASVSAPHGASGASGAASPARGAQRFVRPSKDELKAKLTAEQYAVTQEEGTERPFRNAYWNNHEPGLYVDITTGEPLFSSTDKFESGTGWPSFTRPVEKGHVLQRDDTTLGMTRSEVRSSAGDAHLGHVFDDGPAPTGLRYCINSASLRFIPVAKLEAEGYGDYARLFAPGR